jgi:MFS family permease
MAQASLRGFSLILLGQAISLMGSSITGFALGIWAYQQAGSVTDFGMIALAATLPMALLSPVAGALVDQWNRKLILLGGQTAAVIMTALMAWLFWHDQLQLWHIIGLTAIGSVFNAFVMPTISATVPLMVPKQDLNRANALIALAMGLVQLGSPALAGALLLNAGLKWIFVIDLLTFIAGVSVLIFSRIPQPEAHSDDSDPMHKGQILPSLLFSLNYLRRHQGLLQLILFAAVITFNIQAIMVLILPMLLGFTNEQTLGIVGSIAGFGTLVGSAFILGSGGPKRQMIGVLLGGVGISFGYMFGPISTNIYLVTAACFFIMCCFPVVTTCAQTLFQRKIPLTQQGRVFGLRNFIIGMMQPLAILITAPLADHVFEPAMLDGGQLAGLLGPIYGLGQGRGAAVMISCLGLMTLCWTLIAALTPTVRKLDLLLPDQVNDESSNEGNNKNDTNSSDEDRKLSITS